MKKQLGPKTMIMPMPALLVGTYGADDTPNAMTAAWTAVCCQKPVCVGVAVRHNRFTFQNLEDKKAFTLNVPRATQAAEVDYLGMVSGANEPNKVAKAGFDTEKGHKVDAPIITPCPINLECALKDKMELGSHTWFAGEVLEVHVDDTLVLENGTLNINKLDPIIYITAASKYHTLGDPVAQAYSIGNKFRNG